MVLWSALALAFASALADVALDEVPLVQRSINERELIPKPAETEDKQPRLVGILRTRGALGYGRNASKLHRERRAAKRALLSGKSEAGAPTAPPAVAQRHGGHPEIQKREDAKKDAKKEAQARGQCTKQERLNMKEEDAELEEIHTTQGDMAIVAKAPGLCTQGPVTWDNGKPCLAAVYDVSDHCAECPRLFLTERFESCSNRCEYEKLYCPDDPDEMNRTKQCFTAMGVCDGCRMPIYKKRMRCEGGMRDEARTFKAFDNYIEECEKGTMTVHKYRLFRREVETKNVEDPPMPVIQKPKKPAVPKDQVRRPPPKPARPGQTGWDVQKERDRQQPRPQQGQPTAQHPPRARAAQRVAHPAGAKAKPEAKRPAQSHKPKAELSKY